VSAADVAVPDIGDFGDVPVIEIHVAAGDVVAAEDPLVTLESDKATMDVPAPFPGTISELRVAIGDRVSEGTVLLVVDRDSAGEEGEAAPAEAAPSPAPDQPDADVVVIGAGIGGYTCAFRAADLGLRVVLVEREPQLGGVCLNVGCIPSKALLHAARVIAEAQEMADHGIALGDPKVDIEKLIDWKASVVGRLTGGLAQMAKARGVEVIHGEAELTGDHTLRVGDRELSFGSCVIAAGSEPARLPFVPDDPRVLDSTSALAPTSIPERLLVIGGGIIGLEMASSSTRSSPAAIRTS
jgi:dihydrolipoamide dehydrogenase